MKRMLLKLTTFLSVASLLISPFQSVVSSADIGSKWLKGLMQAAELAGMNVLSLVYEHSGAALQYGIDKDFIGASTTYAALIYFSAYNANEYGKTVSVYQFQLRWDAELGGQNMELRLIKYFADEFNKQVENEINVRKSPKVMAKLKKQVKRTTKILSANTMALISVESLYDDEDFR